MMRLSVVTVGITAIGLFRRFGRFLTSHIQRWNQSEIRNIIATKKIPAQQMIHRETDVLLLQQNIRRAGAEFVMENNQSLL